MATPKKFKAQSSKLQRFSESRPKRGLPAGLGLHSWNFSGVWILVLGVSLVCSPLRTVAADAAIPALPQVSSGDASNRVYRAYLELRDRFATDNTNAQTAWNFARACFDRADFSTNNAQRAELAEQGIAASKRSLQLDPQSAAAYFYLGVNLGQLARTKLFSALGLLDDMEAAWEKSIQLDKKFNHAAAHRSLGLLYLDAPGWPISLGSRSKARQYLQKAIELVPEYPENHLAWLEARLRWGEMRETQSQLATVEAALQSARTNFTGETWARDWEDWDARWKAIKAKAGASTTAHSPRDLR